MHHKRFGELRKVDAAGQSRLDLSPWPGLDADGPGDEAPADLAGQLWICRGDRGRLLLADIGQRATDMPGRFVVAAAMVRHLTDPMLLAELLPADWPGAVTGGVPATLATAMANDAMQLNSWRHYEDLMRVERKGRVTIARPASCNGGQRPDRRGVVRGVRSAGPGRRRVGGQYSGVREPLREPKAFGTPEANRTGRPDGRQNGCCPNL